MDRFVLLLAAFGVVSVFAQPAGLEGGTEYPLTAGWYQGQSTY